MKITLLIISLVFIGCSDMGNYHVAKQLSRQRGMLEYRLVIKENYPSIDLVKVDSICNVEYGINPMKD